MLHDDIFWSDGKPVEVKLAKKCSYFADICAAPPTFPVRKDLVEENGGEGYKISKAFASNGAYSLETWERDDKLALVKNAAVSMMGTEQLVQKPVTGLRLAYFNNQEYPFIDPNVRQAFSLAVDRNSLVDDQSVSSGTPLAAFVPYGISDPSTGTDFRKAKETYFSVKSEVMLQIVKRQKSCLLRLGSKTVRNSPMFASCM